ncbi:MULTISPECIES: helix-turn-helix transcriptional regulator [Acidobacterium]|uniref:helix-turn-helix domain-containing protein n=1 Tax=Acidobacterium TaxID=33973 RepID=UPI00059ED97C|nr:MULTISPECIES: helix-turn-helix transcriptional regulator [Acidobacterium]HCT62405.1 XRE family transcriptional regulator [Acidobacterium sp.]
MTFSQLHERLRIEIWRRIERGVVTGKLLAVQTGLQPSHISNFLHGKRNLSLPALDRLLTAQQLSIQDLVNLEEQDEWSGASSSGERIPIVSASVAIHSASIVPVEGQTYLTLPEGELQRFPPRNTPARRRWERFVALRVTAHQASPMQPVLKELSLAVIDRHYNSLVPVNPPLANLYAVRLGSSLVFRYVSFEGSRLLLRPRLFTFPIDAIELPPLENPSDVLVGRVCLCVTEA